jgi:hypothetical protein
MLQSMNIFLRDRGGNISLLFGAALVPTVMAGAVAVDYSRLSSQRTQIQAALDAAVLAGVIAGIGQHDAAARLVFGSNVPSGVVVTAQSYQLAGDGTLTGNASASVPMRMSGFLGREAYSVTVSSAARMGAPTTREEIVIVPEPPPAQDGACVLVLDPSGSQALLVNSGAEVDTPQCEIHVRSTANPAAIFNSGTSLNAKRFCIAGADVIQNSTTTRNLETGCSTVSDPFAGRYAAPSTACTIFGQNYLGDVTLNPGVYCGWFNFNSATNVTFNPGVYVIKDGGWNVNGGSFKGSGVSFYFADTSKIQFNSGMDTDLTPPSSGALKGVLFFEAPGLPKSDFIFNNSIANRMDGLIYMPSRNVTFNADSKLASDRATIVVHRLIWNNVKLKLQPNPDVPLSGEVRPSAAGGGGTRTERRTVSVPSRPTLVR